MIERDKSCKNITMKVVVLVLSCAILALSQNAPECNGDNCKLAQGCRCSDVQNPIQDADDPAPQLVSITISEAISRETYVTYWKPLFLDRDDADQIGLTFFVPHQYTDYTLVNDLYKRGHEIGSYSITKNEEPNYWVTETAATLTQEFDGQRTILSKFANIDPEDIRGVRTPFLQLDGDTSIQAYGTNFHYDSSWPSKSTDHFLPYTLNGHSLQSCDTVPHCPILEHDGFWVLPITNIKGTDGEDCNFLSSCTIEGTSNDISNWLYNQVDAVRNDNRAPVTILLDSKWFDNVENSFDGFSRFLDRLIAQDDIFLVTLHDVLDWIQKPVGTKEYTKPDHTRPDVTCLDLLCPLQDTNDDAVYMESCVPCPNKYPSLGNPEGN